MTSILFIFLFIFIFPFYVFLHFLAFYVFFYFFGLFMFFTFLGFLCFYFLYFFGVDKGVSLATTYSSIAMRKSDLRSSLRTEHWLNCFFIFIDRLILTKQKSFKALDL